MVEQGVTTIAKLDPNLPAKSDYISEGDDHLRLIKHSLKTTFPNVDAALTSPFSELSKVTDYMDFKRDSGDTYNIVEFEEKTAVKKVMDGTADDDVPSLGQVKKLFETFLSANVYPIGSYYISESNVDPAQALNMPKSLWDPISGFLGGVGTVSADNTVYSIVAGDTGAGHVQAKLTAANLPRVNLNTSNLTLSSDTHSHIVPIGSGHADNNSSGNGPLYGKDANDVPANITTESDTHTHTITGTMSFGQTDPTPVNLIPRHRGVYIWKRSK